ncbi:3-keto-steroid reductase [Teratosphaeriaceae sp. CCFEE 6253]|nr:3-keto-steroid reductase [Teratosphaeriaceae sp. CCFEE 6253]
MESQEDPSTFTVLISGANSGLGFAICCRLIDEFLHTRPPSQSLHLLYSTRDARKRDDTSRRLHAHLQKTSQKAYGQTPRAPRVKIEGVLVDLTKLATVKALADGLLRRGQALDAAMFNAGVAGWLKTDYLKGTWDIMTDLVHATTYPEFMIPIRGLLAAPQSTKGALSGKVQPQDDEPGLGQVFLANVFGHYMLTHWLAPLFTPSSRLIWISSTSALPPFFHLDDIQGLQSRGAYESSKRLTDLLVLTSELPSTKPYVRALLDTPSARQDTPAIQAHASDRPKMYLTHPGVIGTAIAELPWYLNFWMIAAMYFARWLSSPWHPVDPYKGAISAVFAALSPESQLPSLETEDGKGKWGSSTGVYGDERVARTEVEGWGFCGVVGRVPPGSVTTGRWRGRTEMTREGREDFEEQGRRVWREMEELRQMWEERLD